MRPTTRSLIAALALALLAVGSACGSGGSATSDSAADPAVTSSTGTAPSTTAADEGEPTDEVEPADDPSTQPDESAPGDPSGEPEPSVDLDQPPSPDPDATAEDFPDFEWAFEQGRQEAAYGRTDYYNPSSVNKPGTMAGLAAAKAYYAGFARGLADYAAAQAAQQSSKQAAERSELADGPVGELLPGIDPKQASMDFWGVSEIESCENAAATDPCLDVRYNADRAVVVVARLDAADGPDLDHAMLLSGQMRGYKIEMFWDGSAEPGSTLPDWAQQPAG